MGLLRLHWKLEHGCGQTFTTRCESSSGGAGEHSGAGAGSPLTVPVRQVLTTGAGQAKVQLSTVGEGV